MRSGILTSMRPHQWVKNSFVLAPLVFSHSLLQPGRVGLALLATVLFCAVSGAVYVFNDLADREGDRQHPQKRYRPIASGRLPEPVARVWATGILAGSGLLSIWIGLEFAAILLAYFAMNLAYSAWLKHVAFVDVSVIALGFLLRVLSGAFAIQVPISLWLILCTFLLSLYLALGKRKHELLALGSGGQTRGVLNQYQLHHVKPAMIVVALATAAGYTGYTLDPTTAAQFDTPLLPVTIPFIAVGIFRFYRLTERRDHPESPTEQMIRDRPFLANLAAWGVVVLWLIYFH